MRTFLLLMLFVMLPNSLVSAAPTQVNRHVAGDLARDRLQGMDSILLYSDQVAVARYGQVGIMLPPSQTKTVLARLADLTLDDALYVDASEYDRNSNANSQILIVGSGAQTVTIFIRRDKPYLTIMRLDGNGWVVANYLPVLSKVIRLLQAVNPNDHPLSAFHPMPTSVTAANGIPAVALARIATIKPGMTRADLLRVFTTEGGLSTTYWNHYVYRDTSKPVHGWGVMQVPGGFVKVNVDFAPNDADIDWLNGRGFWLHQSDYHSHAKPASIEGQLDDIILRVSLPYIRPMITD